MPGLFIPITSQSKTLITATGTTSATTNSIVPAVPNHLIKVCTWALYTTSTTEVICQFLDGATPIWTVPLQTVQNTVQGFDLGIDPPGFIFCASQSNALGLSLSVSTPVIYYVTYWTDDVV